MRTLDWIVLIATTLLIVIYGIWRSRGAKNIEAFLLSNRDMKWWTIGLSIMATQASAITFLSTPGQAFDDGMRFVQFYFGLPIAIVIISIVAIPIYHKLNVYTAYEYLESRFDLKTRSLGAGLFLVSRGLAAGMTIYAPAIILSVILGWPIYITCIGIGAIVIVYTVSGGTKAVSQTQKQQMLIILLGMLIAGIIMVLKFPRDISMGNALTIAGKMGKLNAITFPSNWSEFVNDRYNLLTGLIGGSFLALSYFGTDQSQVQRYLGGKSVAESRIGMLFNAMVKIPMQFLILFIGVMLFVFYQFEQPPLFFNSGERDRMYESQYADAFQELEARHAAIHNQKQEVLRSMVDALDAGDQAAAETYETQARTLSESSKRLKVQGLELMERNNPLIDKNDLDKVFLTFVIEHLPVGFVGLLIAVILAAAMSSTAAELNALATCTVIDIYKRTDQAYNRKRNPSHYLHISRVATFSWGIFAILFSLFANRLGNLIQAVNIVGSLFYGAILGLFVIAFFFEAIKGTATFWAAVIAEVLIIALWGLPQLFPESLSFLNISFLWFNLIGCLLVVALGMLFQMLSREK